MSCMHLIRVGALGAIDRFRANDPVHYPRGTRVVLLTERGLEHGEVLSTVPSADGEQSGGTIVRALTVEDELLLARLEQNRQAAIEACHEALEARGLPVVLLDAELLLDGGALVFYFLGEDSAELEALSHELAETYEARAHIRRFTDAVNEGCGPNCGTAEASGCGNCATQGCALASACSNQST